MVGPTTRHTELIAGPHGQLECLTRGSGRPATVFAHGLGGSIATTRPYGGMVRGQKTFVHLAGHGASTPPPQMTYAALASEVWAVADHVGATAALGISMGAGALCAGLAADPDRFDALVLVLPAAVDLPRDDPAMDRFAVIADLVQSHDVEAVAQELIAMESPSLQARPSVRAWSREQAARLMSGGAVTALTQLPHQTPLTGAEALGAVRAPVLILAAQGDPVHPVSAAQRLGEALPHSHVEVLPEGGIMWAHRDRVRARVGQFLAEHTVRSAAAPRVSAAWTTKGKGARA